MVTAALAALLAVAQPATQPYDGTWTAALEGKTYARLELSTVNGTTAGRISLGAVHFGPSGEVTEVLKPATNFTPIFDVVIRNGVLSFARKDDGQTDRFELRFVNGDAQLTFVLSADDRAELAAQGVANVKPTRLTKLGSAR